MKRSGGVTASAVIAIIGSLFLILVGGVLLATVMMARFPPIPEGQPDPPIPPVVAVLVQSILCVGLGAWGIVSAVGLLRLKNWARICFLIFAGILCFFSVIGTIGFFIAMLIMPQNISPQENVSPGLMKAVLAVFGVFMLMHAALGGWWLVYFNRRNIKVQFLEKTHTATLHRGPLSIKIIAWLMVVGGLSVPFQLFLSYPAIMFGFVLRGWPVRILLILSGLVSLLVGLGMLLRRAKAHTLAVTLYGFWLLNTVSYFVIPGSFGRMQTLIKELGPSNPAPYAGIGDAFLWFGMLMGLIGTCVPLYFLITRRQSFIDSCASAQNREL